MANIDTQRTLIQLLQRHLVASQKSNPQYSIRSMAKQLGVDHSLLARLLSGKRKIARL